LKTEFRKLHTCIDIVEGEIQMLKDDVAVLKDDVTVLKTDVAELKTDVNRRFDKVEEDTAERRVDVQRVEDQRHNSKICRLFSKIVPIAVYRPGVGAVVSKLFPKTANEF
jgi:predicted  nucleic acid-binding Zn-ribbon protein